MRDEEVKKIEPEKRKTCIQQTEWKCDELDFQMECNEKGSKEEQCTE